MNVPPADLQDIRRSRATLCRRLSGGCGFRGFRRFFGPAAVERQNGGETKQGGGPAKPVMCFHRLNVFSMFDFDCHPQHASRARILRIKTTSQQGERHIAAT